MSVMVQTISEQLPIMVAQEKDDIQIPITEDFFRIDEDIFAKYPQFVDGNAFHDTLRGSREVKLYEVYQKRTGHEVACVIKLGDRLNGHPGIVHGGIISTVFDNSYGWLFITMEIPPAFTVNLNVNFRKPVFENSTALVRAKVTEIKVPLATLHVIFAYVLY